MERDIMDSFIQKIQRQQNDLFTTCLREFAKPPIKGEITKGKIRWRGIRIVTCNEFDKIRTYLTQRGDRISPEIVIEINKQWTQQHI